MYGGQSRSELGEGGQGESAMRARSLTPLFVGLALSLGLGPVRSQEGAAAPPVFPLAVEEGALLGLSVDGVQWRAGAPRGSVELRAHLPMRSLRGAKNRFA